MSFTDHHGDFTLMCGPEGLAINVYSPQYGLASFNDLRGRKDEFLELRMPGMATLSGRVTPADGTPAAGIKVNLMGSISLGGGISRVDQVYSAVTDQNGQYQIREINAGQEMEAKVYDADGGYRARKRLGYLPPNQVTTWDPQFSKPIVVRGTVRGMQNHQPLAVPGLLRVSVVKDGVEVISVGGRPEECPDGTYELTVPAGSGRYLIVPSYSPNSFHTFESYGREVFLLEGTEQTVDLTLPDTIELTIHVVNERGEALKGATIERWGMMYRKLSTTDETGHFVYNGFGPEIMQTGEGWLKVMYPGRFPEESRQFSGTPGQVLPEETIVLHPEGEITGRLILVDGAPLANGKFTACATYGNGIHQILDLVTDSKGQFRLKIPATQLDLEGALVSSDPPNSFSRTALQCPTGQTLNLGDISLENIDRSPKNE